MHRGTHKHSIRYVLAAAATVFVLLTGAWYGIKYYFTHVDPIAAKVRQDVMQRISLRHGHFLTYSQIPATYRKAVVSTEDRTFYSNIGIDPVAIIRASLVDLESGKFVQGGSTITQQLVHNTVLRHTKKSIPWKMVEIIDAIGLYDTMSKDEILTLYANDIYFGNGAYGIYQAAHTYFGRVPARLNQGELTMLAGIPNSPTLFDPFHSLTLAKKRQNVVLNSMVATGVISTHKAKEIAHQPIALV